VKTVEDIIRTSGCRYTGYHEISESALAQAILPDVLVEFGKSQSIRNLTEVFILKADWETTTNFSTMKREVRCEAFILNRKDLARILGEAYSAGLHRRAESP
jgi:hypothetical protein